MTAVPSAESAALLVRHGRRVRRARSTTVAVVLAIVGFAVFCVSISVGDFPIPIVDVVPAVFGFGDRDAHFIVHTLRLPRALTAALVGAAFGLSGAVFQTLARNPLASPDIIGITSGASAGAVFVILVLSGTTAAIAFGALAGALVTALAIYVLAWRRGVSSYRMVLVGIGLGAVLVALTQYMLTRARVFEAQRAAVWLPGSLNGRGWDHVRPLSLAMLVLVPVVLVLARPLDALQLGDDTAKGVGVDVQRSRAAVALIAVMLAAVATASAGPIVFVALISAPIARRLTRAAGANLVPAALCGAVLVLTADLIGRRILAPHELPVGVITGIIGGPYLLWLLARANKIGTGG